MTEEADPTHAASGAEAAPSPDKKKKKTSKTTTKKQPSSSSKSKTTKQKASSSKSKGGSSKSKAVAVEDKPGPTKGSPVEGEPEDVQAEEVMLPVPTQQEIEVDAAEDVKEEEPRMEEDGGPSEAHQATEQESADGTGEVQESKEEDTEGVVPGEAEGEQQDSEKVEPDRPSKGRESAEARSPLKRPRGPGGPSSLLEYFPRTSINGTCGGPWRSSAYCSWLHDTVGCTCRREAGGPLPEKWASFSDFLAAIDIRDTADKKVKGALVAKEAEKEKADNAEKPGETETTEEKQQEQREQPAGPFTSPNPLMVNKLLLLPCKTFLSAAFAPQLFRCRPYSPVGLQEQFDGAQRRRAGIGRRSARGAAATQRQQKASAGKAEQEKQEKPAEVEEKEEQEQDPQGDKEPNKQEEQQQEQQQQQQPPARRPIMYGSECLIDEGRMRILSVINLCLTERHYEPQLLRRDGLPVFWHKSQGGGEVPTPEGLLLYFKLLSLLTMQGVRTAEQWAAAADCAVCSNSGGPRKGGIEGPPCTCDWRFTVVTHCTHGVNRTGYVVCALLMALIGLSAAEAERVFAQARGHSIPRQEIVTALQQLEKDGISEALRGALKAPELDPIYAENAEADGIDLTKGGCLVRVAEGGATTTEKGRTIPIPEGFHKSLTSYRESERQRLIRAKQPRQKKEQQHAAKQQQRQQQQQEAKEEGSDAQKSGGQEETEKEEGKDETKEETNVKEETSAQETPEVTLTEEEMQQLPVVPSVIPNNGVVLFGPLSNALLAPEELMMYLLDLHQNLRICDYRVLVSADMNAHLGYPQAIRRGGGNKRKRRVGVPIRTLGKTQQEKEKEGETEAETEQQQQEQEAQQQEQQKKVEEEGEADEEGKKKIKPLEYHYVLYVQAADSFSFQTLLTSEFVSLRKQPLQAFTSDFISYLLARGKELDAASLKWSIQHPPRPKRGVPPLPMGGVPPPFPMPGFGGPLPPPHMLNWMGPGGPRRGPQDAAFGPPFMRGNGRMGGKGEGDFGGKPLGTGPAPFRGGPQWNAGPPPPPPPPPQPSGPWKGPAGDINGPRFLRGGRDNHQGPPPEKFGRFENMTRDSGPPGARQGPPPRDFYDAFRQQQPAPPAGGSWRAPNPQGWRPGGPLSNDKPAPGGGTPFQHPKENDIGDSWRGNNWERRPSPGGPGAWRQGPPGGPPGGPQWGVGPEADGSGAPKRHKPNFNGNFGRDWNGPSPDGGPRGDWGGFGAEGPVGGPPQSEWGGPGRTPGGPGGPGHEGFGGAPGNNFPGGPPFRGTPPPGFNNEGAHPHQDHQFGGPRGPGMMPPQQQQARPYNNYPPNFMQQQQQPGGGASPPAFGSSPFQQGGAPDFGAAAQQQQQQQQQPYEQHPQQGFPYPQQQQMGQSQAQEPVPAYVMQLLQQQAAQRGASVDPQVLAQLYTQYYQSFLSSMSHSSGGQQLTQEQLMQYLQQMQQQQPAH